MKIETSIEILRLGRDVPYESALAAQRVRRAGVESGELPEALILLEHAPVITLGRNASEKHLLASREALLRMGINVVETDRGGDVTYHGPGQLVAYPILHLERRGLSITRYLRLLEQAVIDALAEFGIRGERASGFTGVWVAGAKIAAIGVAVHRGVSLHGAAINVNPDMAHWDLIVPCGIPDKAVTSLDALLNGAPGAEEIGDAFTRFFFALLGAHLR